ncbi:TAO3 [[Candida] subhashii]|uniref:TAO3 n=1 Tax=[Candida] subhashii TaxID=561895 RepID=A0A8J5Q4M8_9ASCO|nr:TAO3 [[Candida] subhashii]KAG7661544.1 TAO3 [[Candida] subhashii]
MIEIPDLDELSLESTSNIDDTSTGVQYQQQQNQHHQIDHQQYVNGIQNQDDQINSDSIQEEREYHHAYSNAPSKQENSSMGPSFVSIPEVGSRLTSDPLNDTIALYNKASSPSLNNIDRAPEIQDVSFEKIEYRTLQDFGTENVNDTMTISDSVNHSRSQSQRSSEGHITTQTLQAAPRMQYFNGPTDSFDGHAPPSGFSFISNRINEHTTSFRLQDPPNIKATAISRGHPSQEDETLSDDLENEFGENNDQLGQLIDTPNPASHTVKGTRLQISQQLASPISVIPRDHTEPSPQLPPPLTSSSLQKLTFNNGEEFGSIRRELATDAKTPAEYTLHIVFTQFVRHAERKLNQCLEYPLNEEPPIVDLIAEGADKQFDKIVSSLGYIARRKPKPVIDSVMFWRKSKSEVATMAANEVERTIELAKSGLMKVSNVNFPPSSLDSMSTQTSSIVISPANPGIAKNVNPKGKSKRSLSLMRSKSFSKVGVHRRNQSASSAVPQKSPEDIGNENNNEFIKQKNYFDEQINQARETAIQADRKSLASIYILCRVLIEVVKQTSFEVMGEDLGDKLEEIVYTQLKTTDPVSTSQSLVRAANWSLFAELLGFMSERRFLGVSDRFIADLEKVDDGKKTIHQEEQKLRLLINGMRYLKLTNYPLEAFEETAEFIKSLAKFFDQSINEVILCAYCEVLTSLLLPLGNILTAETNHPTWVEGIERIYEKSRRIWRLSMITNTYGPTSASPSTTTTPTAFPAICMDSCDNAWAHSLTLMVAALSVSRKELFSEVWYDIIEENHFKLKGKDETLYDKITYIECITRLLWVYINRLPDSLNNTIKKLDSVFDLLLFNLPSSSNKKYQWLTSDIRLINSLAELIKIVGYNHLNYTLDNVLLKLLKLSFSGSTLENSSPEKLILVTKSYLSILKTYELGQKPKFPTEDNSNQEFGIEKVMLTRMNEFMFIAKNTTNAASHEEICRNIAALLLLLDQQYGCASGGAPSSANGGLSAKSQSAFNFHFGYDFTSSTEKASRYLQIELFSTIIEAIPWTMAPIQGESKSLCGLPFKQIVEILTRNSIHSNPRISNSAVFSLKMLAARKNPTCLLSVFAKNSFQLYEKTDGSGYNAEYLNSREYIRLLRLYTELLSCWLSSYQIMAKAEKSNKNRRDNMDDDDNDQLMNKDVLNDLYQINHKSEELSSNDAINNKMSTGEDLEWQIIITLVEEIEGNGLFFLCSQDPKIRFYGSSILKLVDQFDQAIYNLTDSSSPKASRKHSRTSSKFAADFGTRLIHVLEDTDFMELIKPFRKELSLPERQRLAKIKNKKNILIRLAESDYGIDSTIWFRVFPRMLEIFFQRCPMSVALCRNMVCVSLVQMHEAIFEYSESFKANTITSSLFSSSKSNQQNVTSTSVPPELLVIQWKLYLIFACSTLTATQEQKISFPTQPIHGRKRSLQMYIQHQKITSAKSVFRMVVPLLKSQQVMIREAIISALSHMNINIFKTFLESIPLSMSDWNCNDKKRDIVEDRLRIEIVHILMDLTSKFSSDNSIYSDQWIVENLVAIVKCVKTFLSMPNVQVDIGFQRLRRYFCGFLENVYVGLRDKSRSNVDRWLPFEARLGCFNYLKEWCGIGESKAITEDRYKMIVRNINQQNKDVAVDVAILDLEKKKLQLQTLSCMAVLCSGEIKQQIEVSPGVNLGVVSFDIPGILSWIHKLLESERPEKKINEYGKVALRNILENNFDNEDIYNEVVKECYYCSSGNDGCKTTESYFCIFVDIFMRKHKSIEEELPNDLVSLASFLVGHNNIEVRSAAIELLKYLEELYLKSSSLGRFSEAVISRTQVVYKKAMFDISSHLRTLAQTEKSSFIRISYMTMYFSIVGNASRRDILACLLPLVQNVVLKYEEAPEGIVTEKNPPVDPKLDTPSLMVLSNLFEITVKFGSKISNEVEALWVSLGSNAANFDKIIDFIMKNCIERKNPTFVQYSRQIIDYLTYSRSDPLYVIEKFVNNLQPKMMVPPHSSVIRVSLSDANHDFAYVADLSSVIPKAEKDSVFSLGQLSMIFLVDLFTTKRDIMVEKLPLLLHIAFSLLDHYLPVVQEQACSLLIHLIHALAIDEPKAQETIDILRSKDQVKNLWVYDDLNNDKKGARTPKNMDLLVRNVLKVFAKVTPTLQDDWSRVSLHWATTCAVRHIACRSFQLFRSLLSFLDQGMLKDMLHRLSNTISDETVDIQGFAMQILMTLNAITAELDSEKLIDFPQLFWSSVACLSTIHEQEFIEVLSTMNKFVSKIDLDAPDTVSCLISTFPPKWEGKFEGLQQIVLVGLRSATSWEPSLKFLDKLIYLKDSEIIGKGDSRLLMSVLANLPRFLHELDKKAISVEIQNAALAISKLADNANKVGLSKILVSLSKNRFRSKKDFLVQTVSTIKNSFFPEFEAQTLVLLLGLLSNKIPWVTLETMSILKHVFPLVDLQRDEFVGVGADLISPLLRLLLTDFAEPALEVLDEAVIISGSQLDRDVLRMSLGSTAMKKEYENTATLFGIPDESGWSIPMPAVTAASTRNNVHAVFSTCVVTTVVDDENDDQVNNEEIQFHMEDYYSHAAGPTDYGDAVSVSVEEKEASLSNVWAALDDFDSFFTKDTEPNISGGRHIGPHPLSSHIHSASVDTKYSATSDVSSPMESAPNVYDKKVSVILNRSLARTQSNASFKTTLADSIGSNNYVNTNNASIAKRSYIPFRNRNTPKSRVDQFSTPIMPLTPVFDQQTLTDLKTPTVTTPGTFTMSATPSSVIPEFSFENPTRFEGLLGGKKRSKRTVAKNSPIPSSSGSNISPSELMNTNFRSPNILSSALNTTPEQQTPSLSSNSSKDKRKASQKFR